MSINISSSLVRIRPTLLAIAATTIVGCSATPVTPEGAQVRIVDNQRLAAQIEESCEWLGEVNGSQGNFFTADVTSEKAMMEGARNSLRNQAANMGANTVIIQRHHATESEMFIGTGGHSFIGQAFICNRTKL